MFAKKHGAAAGSASKNGVPCDRNRHEHYLCISLVLANKDTPIQPNNKPVAVCLQYGIPNTVVFLVKSKVVRVLYFRLYVGQIF